MARKDTQWKRRHTQLPPKQNKQTKKQKTNKTNKHLNKHAKQTEFQGWQGRTHGSLFPHCTHTSIETNTQSTKDSKQGQTNKERWQGRSTVACIHTQCFTGNEFYTAFIMERTPAVHFIFGFLVIEVYLHAFKYISRLT